MMKTIVKGAIRDEKGAVLILALILLVVGGLVLTPLLGFMSTGLLAGQVYERHTHRLYAADAGVEDAVWKIRHPDQVPELPVPSCHDPNPDWAYNISDVNGKSVTVNMTWVDNFTYRVVSTATGDGSGTTIEAYIEVMVFDLFAGALVSKNDINFHKDCTVTGDVYYVGEITGKEYEHIDGEEIQISLDSFPTQEENEAFAQQFKDEALVGGTYNGTMTINSDTTLGPLYITGNLDINKDVTVTLTGTIYVEGSIGSDKEFTVTGSGSIVAVGDIHLHKLPNYGIEGDTIIMSLTGQIKFWKDGYIEALVYAPNGDINIEKNMTVLGGVIGANIYIKKDGSFTYESKTSSFGFPFLITYGAEIKTYDINPS